MGGTDTGLTTGIFGSGDKIVSVAPNDDFTVIFSVLALICLTAVTRFEKVLKDLFGIGESKHLGSTTGNFVKAVSGVRATTSMIKKMAAPAIKGIRGHKEMKSIEGDLKKMEGSLVQKNANGYYSMIDNSASGDDSQQPVANNTGSAPNVDSSFAQGADEVLGRLKETIDEHGVFNPDEEYLNSRRLFDEANARFNLAQISGDATAMESADKDRKLYSRNIEKAQERFDQDHLNSLNKLYENEANTRLMQDRNSRESIGTQQANQEAQQAASSGNGSQPINVHNDIGVEIKDGQGKATSTTDGQGKTTTNVRTKDDGRLYEDQDGNVYNAEERKQREAKALVKKYNEARKARNIAVADTIFNAGSTFAGVGFAAGAWDEFHEITNAGNMISEPFVHASTAALNWNEDRRMKKNTRVVVEQETKYEYKDNPNDKNIEKEFKKKVAREQAKKNLDIDGGTRKVTVHDNTEVNREENIRYNNNSKPQSYTTSSDNGPINVYSQQDVNEYITQNRNVHYKEGRQSVSGNQIKPIGNTTQDVKSVSETNEDITQNRNTYFREGKTTTRGNVSNNSSGDTVTKTSSRNTINETQEFVKNIQKTYKETVKSGNIPYDSQAILMGRDSKYSFKKSRVDIKDINGLN